MWLKITNNYSPNFSLPKRSHKKIKYIVIHYTGMKSEFAAIKRLCDESKKVSAPNSDANNREDSLNARFLAISSAFCSL